MKAVVFCRAAAGRRGREEPAALRSVVSFVVPGTTGLGTLLKKGTGTNGTVEHKSIFAADLRRHKAVVGGGYF